MHNQITEDMAGRRHGLILCLRGGSEEPTDKNSVSTSESGTDWNGGSNHFLDIYVSMVSFRNMTAAIPSFFCSL